MFYYNLAVQFLLKPVELKADTKINLEIYRIEFCIII